MARFRFRVPRATGARLKTVNHDPGSEGGDGGLLSDVFGEDPRFEMTLGDLDAYQVFRHQEPALVSIVDGKPEMAKDLDALVLRMDGTPVGAVSFLVRSNPRKPPPSDSYGRIDIVIVPASSRGVGLGRLLLLSGNLVLLRNHGSSLYSISCLAAHAAVATVLESVGFTPDRRENTLFVHEELRLEGEDWRGLERAFTSHLTQSFHQVRYALRQKSANG